MRLSPKDISWENLRAVIFDMDGTLYNQKRLRRIMAFKLLRACLRGPRYWQEARIVYHFRKERERRALSNISDIESRQYIWAAEKLGVTPELVTEAVCKWMYDAPLKYLYRCRYAGAGQFIGLLRRKGIATAVFSDYPSTEKLKALKIMCDLTVSATDKGVDRLKPDPGGVFMIMEKLGVAPEHCLFIGDRDDRDGECARRSGMNYLIIDRASAEQIYSSLIAGLSLLRDPGADMEAIRYV